MLTGPGLVNLGHFVHDSMPRGACDVLSRPMTTIERPAAITAAGLEGSCEGCIETLELFVSALGAEAGNLGLRALATGGVYLGGGIPRKMLPALRTATFLDAFRSKGPMRGLVEKIPVTVITEPDAAVLGAAIAAGRALSDPTALA